MRDLSFNPAFIQGVSRYLGRQDASVRRCGLLVGREIARMSGKSLEFGVWDGDDSGKVWARTLRRLIQGRDVDVVLGTVDAETAPKATPGVVDDAEVEEFVSPAERKAAMVEEVEERQPEKVQFKSTAQGYDSDNSLAGYDSPPSSRTASPSPSEIEEIEKDSTLNVAVKVQRPVCLRQLGDLLRGTGQKAKSYEPHEADKIEMALNYAEELIRKKRDYEQNWVSIACIFGLEIAC
jgi:telomere length regulation protein